MLEENEAAGPELPHVELFDKTCLRRQDFMESF